MFKITKHQRNANQNHSEILPLILSEWLVPKRQEITSVDVDVKKREALGTVHGNVYWCSHYEKQYGGSPKNLRELAYDPAIPLLESYPQNTKILIQKDICHVPCSLHYL